MKLKIHLKKDSYFFLFSDLLLFVKYKPCEETGKEFKFKELFYLDQIVDISDIFSDDEESDIEDSNNNRNGNGKKSSSTSNSFEIETNDFCLTLIAESHSEKTEWMEDLRSCLQNQLLNEEDQLSDLSLASNDDVDVNETVNDDKQIQLPPSALASPTSEKSKLIKSVQFAEPILSDDEEEYDIVEEQHEHELEQHEQELEQEQINNQEEEQEQNNNQEESLETLIESNNNNNNNYIEQQQQQPQPIQQEQEQDDNLSSDTASSDYELGKLKKKL